MSDELYLRIYRANLKCIGIWHDFPVNGAMRSETYWSEIRRFSKRDLAKTEGKRFIYQMKRLFCDKSGTCKEDKIEEMMVRLGIDEVKTLPMKELNGEVSYWPPTCYEFAYKIDTVFERIRR